MTQSPRPYRAGLGLPPAVIIRSSHGPSRFTPDPHLPSETQDENENLSVNENVFNAYQNRRSAHPYPQGESEYLSREDQWKEWNTNPTLHGPPKLVLPPKFVVSSNEYDELGRSINDGVGVSVDKGKQRESRMDKEDGGKVADWYLNLNLASSGSASGIASESNSGGNTPRVKDEPIVIDVDEWEEVQAGPSRSIKPQTIKQESQTTSSSSENPKSIDSKPPLRVHSRDWFIRRALLHTDPSSQPQVKRTTSIGSLLNIKPGDNLPKRQYQPQYVLGPDNKGYEILRDKLGWNGGGLGKPLGWVDGVDPPAGSPSDEGMVRGKDESGVRKGKEEEDDDESKVVELDGNGQPIIDLTLSSDSESEFSEEEEPVYGPGRTAPISTKLKLDRKGLGHRFTSSSSSSQRKIPSLEKKVTHSHKEIEDAKRRSKFGYGKHHGKGLELGKKGKIKWKELDRNERDERRAIKAALG